MRYLIGLALSLATFPAIAQVPSSPPNRAQEKDVGSSKSICVIEHAAGVLMDEHGKEMVSKAIRFDEKHNHFVVVVKPKVRSKQEREWCLSTLSHWTPMLAERGTFDDDPGFSGKPYDLRLNIGHCFASREATIKFFDRDHDSKLDGHDFMTATFVGLAGNWFKARGNNFEAGETLDDGPVVFTGTCKPID